MTKKLYSILELSESASIDEIKAAYKKLAKIYHPDKCKDSTKRVEYEEKFKQIGKAYEILTDENKKEIYDRIGDNESVNIDEMAQQQEQMNNIFNNFSGMAGFRGFSNTVQFNPNIQLNIKLTFEEIFYGKEITHKYNRIILTLHPKQTKIFEEQNIVINIPPGVRNGELISVPNMGNKLITPNGIQIGELICIVEEIPHTTLIRSQHQPLHLIMKHTISIFQALLGNFEIIMTGLDGIKFNVHVEDTIINPDIALCVNGKGMINKHGKVGNMYIMFKIEWPKQLTEEQRNMLKTITNYKSNKKHNQNIVTNYISTEELHELINTPDHHRGHSGHPGQQVHQCNQQ